MQDVDNFAQLSVAERAEIQSLMETLASLGVTPESVKARIVADAASSSGEYRPLEEDEWAVLAPLLPREASQTKTMDNRTFVNAVLKATHQGGRWTEYPKQSLHSDAVRRRFGRWAHLGIWQRAYDAASDSELSSERKSALKLVAQRAERLRHNLL